VCERSGDASASKPFHGPSPAQMPSPFPLAIELQRRRNEVRHRPQLLRNSSDSSDVCSGPRLSSQSGSRISTLVNASWIFSPRSCLNCSVYRHSCSIFGLPAAPKPRLALFNPANLSSACGICLHFARPKDQAIRYRQYYLISSTSCAALRHSLAQYFDSPSAF
jgi:hypothetical protein